MKLLLTGFVFMFGCFLIVATVDAKKPASDSTPGNSANGRAKARPQIGVDRLTGQANPRASSPAPGRGKAMARVVQAQRLARRQKGHKDKSFDAVETTTDGLGKGRSRMVRDAPREAMTRSLSKRLSQIDKIRDKALETGDLDLLDIADRLELRARRKFDEMIARMDQRRELGKPGVGPPVLLPDVEPVPDPDVPETDPSNDPTSFPESDVPADSDLPEENSPDPDATGEPEVEAEGETVE